MSHRKRRASRASAPPPKKKLLTRRRVLAGLALAVSIVVLVAFVLLPGNPPYARVDASVPAGSVEIPSIALDDAFVQRVMTWQQGGWTPSYNDYQRFSAAYWDAGLHFSGTFWLPVTWPGYLNLTGSGLQLDGSSQYILINYDEYLGVHGQVLWIYVIMHDLSTSPYNGTDSTLNHVAPFFAGLNIEEAQYQLRWFIYTQQWDDVRMGYNASSADAPSEIMTNSSTGLTPVTVDGQYVYAHGLIKPGIIPLSGFQPSGSWTYPAGIDPNSVLGNAAVLSAGTVFVLGIPFSMLPHNAQDVFFGTMRVLALDPPEGLSAYWAQAFDPPSGAASANAWQNASDYVQVYAPL